MLYYGHPIKFDVRRAIWSVLAMPRGLLGEDLKYFNFECMEDHYSSEGMHEGTIGIPEIEWRPPQRMGHENDKSPPSRRV